MGGGTGGIAGSGGVAGVGGTTATGGTGGVVACGGFGASAGVGGTTSSCSFAPQSSPVASPVTFRFSNTGTSTLFLHESCTPEFAVTACMDGYAQPLILEAFCSVDCSSPQDGCIVCGACFDGAYAMPPGATREFQWSGETYAFSTRQTCGCHCSQPAASGDYRVTVPVFDSELAVQERRPAYSVSLDFQLPVSGGVLVVSISQ
jgi:hypothetical protein